ncbi:MAG: esterase family protein [Ignavibacteria bacterium]|nr:esterase family protein [Ignavibacteria bacterium]
MNRTIKLFLFIQIFVVSILNGQSVEVIRDSVFSYAVDSYMRYNVILPKDYKQNKERYITIFLLHGYSGGENDWITRTSIVKYAKDFNYIIVTPDGKNSWYTNSPSKKNNNYEDYIIKELIPNVEKKYRVITTRHGRVVAGLSMGGYGAIKFALKYPNYFFFAASFSGAFRYPSMIESNGGNLNGSLKDAFGPKKSEHWNKNDALILADSISNPNSVPFLYIACGKDDNLTGLLESNKNLTDKLRKRNVMYEYHETPGTHNWVYWDKEVLNFLERLSNFDPLKP